MTDTVRLMVGRAADARTERTDVAVTIAGGRIVGAGAV